MSKQYSGRIHDPNHELSDYDLYFNDTLLSGTGIYTAEEIAQIFGSSTQTGASPQIFDNAAPMYPVQLMTEYGDPIIFTVYNKNMLPPIELVKSPADSGITAVVNDDGTITLNGSHTAQTDIYLQTNPAGVTNIFDGVSVTISGCPAGGGASTYRMQICATNTSYGNDDGSGYTVTGRANTRLRIRVSPNVTCTDLVFSPMIRFASFADATFVKAEKQEYTFSPASDQDPVNVMDYAPVKLYEGENVLMSDSGDIFIEYIPK